MSTVPLATRGRRVADVTGLYLTFRFGMASFAFTASTTCLHSSIENPIGCNLSSRYDNGIERHRFALDARVHLQFRIEWLLGAAIGDELDPLEQAASAHITDEGMIAEPFLEPAREVCPLRAHIGQQIVA